MKFKLISVLLPTMLAFVSCNNLVEPPYVYASNLTFTIAKATYYGAHFANEGIENNVLNISFYSEGMLNEKGEITGTGQYLFLENIFIPNVNETLVSGTYTIGKKGESFTFFPGEYYKVDKTNTLVGARIRYIEPSNKNSAIKLITSGFFTVEDDKVTLSLITENNEELTAIFNGQIDYKWATATDTTSVMLFR